MSIITDFLQLFKYDPETDGANTFNIKQCLNDNWDKIDAWASGIKTTIAGLVPGTRKINNKELSADVTLTGEDIKTSASDETTISSQLSNRLPLSGGAMTGPISYGNDRHISGGGTSTDFDFHAGKVAIRLIPENAVGNDISKCVNIRDTGNGALYPIATATKPQAFDLPITAGYEDQIYQNTYYKTQENIVHVSFCINHSDKFKKNEVFATLPVGYRPGHTIARCVAGDGMDFGNGIVVAEIQIYSNGDIMMYHCNSDVKWLLGEFSFIAEN